MGRLTSLLSLNRVIHVREENSAGVLVVDDDDNLRELLEEAILEWGYDVTTAGSGREALRRMARKRFRIIICDLKMPGMDGLELLRKIRKRDETARLIIITGYATIDTAVKTIEAGAFDYVTKPFQLNDLKRIMKKAMVKAVVPASRKRLLEKLGRAYGKLDVMRAIQRNSLDEPG